MTEIPTTSFSDSLFTGNFDNVVEMLNQTIMGVNDSDTGNTTELPDYCVYYEPPLTHVRFWIVSVFGTFVSCISMTENLFIFALFATRKYHRTSYNVYLMFLAFFDFFVSLAYIMLMSVNVLSDYLQSVLLVRLWMSYMIPTITISHIALTTSSFLIVAATFERYCITTGSKYLRKVQKNRIWIALTAVCFGLISKGTMCAEFTITMVDECVGLMTEYALGIRDFVFQTPYHTYWRFWYRNFVTVFFPFFVLAYLNIRIVKALSKQQKHSCADLLMSSVEQSKRKQTTKSATRTMILVVCCYLVSNILNVMLTIWEHVDKDTLLQKYEAHYAIALDFVSLATNLSCAFRVPIYMACQSALRQEIFFTAKHWICCQSAKRSTVGQNNLSPQIPGSPDNICLINGKAIENDIIDQFRNGHSSSLSKLNHTGRLVSCFDEDRLSTTSSVAAQNEILRRLFQGSNKETLL